MVQRPTKATHTRVLCVRNGCKQTIGYKRRGRNGQVCIDPERAEFSSNATLETRVRCRACGSERAYSYGGADVIMVLGAAEYIQTAYVRG